MSRLPFASLMVPAIALGVSTLGCSAGGRAGHADGAAGAAAGTVGTAGTTGAAGAAPGDAEAPVDAATLDAGDAAPGTLPDFADGARLKALVIVTDDGAKLWRGWRDTQRQEACAFQRAEDDSIRCLPTSSSTTTVIFADDACKVPLVSRSTCEGDAPAYVAVGVKDACSHTGPLHKVQKKIATPATVHVLDGLGQCTPLASAPASETWLAAEAAEPPTAFVGAQELRDDRGASLMARYYRADDGALQLLGAYDRAAGRNCAEAPQMTGVCAPDPLTVIQTPGGEFQDAACTIPTTVVNRVCGASVPLPDVVFAPTGGVACASTHRGRFFTLGAVDAERPFLRTSQGCAQGMSPRVFPASPGRHVLGAELPASAFPAVRTVDEGTGRFRIRTVETPEGQHLLPKAIFDTVQNGTCTPTLVAGTLRCVPDEILSEDFHANATCTSPVYVKPDASCLTPKMVTVPVVAPCGPARSLPPRLFEVGGVVTPELLFLKSGDQCYMYPVLGEVHPLTERPLSDAPVIAGD